MPAKSSKYFSSFEMLLYFQHGLRKRLAENYYRLLQKRIVRRLNRYSGNAIISREFITRLSSLLNIPENVYADEAEKSIIVTEAEKTINGVYNLLGSGDIKLDPIEWHTDFKTGFRWPPGTFYKKYIQEDLNSSSDVKVPRELSRCHHLLKLGLAYRLTNNKKYAEVCIDQMKNWIDENPLMYTINWGCTMDVAIRAVNWIWTLGFIAGTEDLDDKTIDKIKCSLYEHGWFIWRNPEKSSVYSGNHYLADLAGQMHLGLMFSDLKEPKHWLQMAKEELFLQMRIEILPSGMTYERSTNYNRLVLELILIPVLLLKNNGHEIPSDIWYRIEKMFDFIMYSLKPDGTTPVIGDQDNGRLLPFNRQETTNLRYLMSLGALLFNRSDLKHHGEGFNVFCSVFGGKGGIESWHNISDSQLDLNSNAFPDIGLFIMRKKDNYLIFNATGRGLYPESSLGSHTHSDLFSFELFTYGKSFLIDPGSYVYTADADQRMLFRSTKMHNTVSIDGESQDMLRREKIWSYSRDAIPQVI
ncbi:MAG: alginate lyase family protein, partial [Bacteroidales bacterium]|nr:alginate lyase family protein [Bacteroidales bacterium]